MSFSASQSLHALNEDDGCALTLEHCLHDLRDFGFGVALGAFLFGPMMASAANRMTGIDRRPSERK